MAKNIVTGIDIGTYHIKVVIADGDVRNEKGFPKVIGAAMAETRGLRHGYVVNIKDVSASIRSAAIEAEKRAGVKIKNAFVGVGGIGLGSSVSSSSVIISKANMEITPLDISRVLEQCEKELPTSIILNRKVIHSIPLGYKVDGQPVLGATPEDMKGGKLEVRMLFITCLEHHLNDILEAVEGAGIRVEDVMAAPVAASLVTLTKSQKIAGVVLANIGAETVSIAVFENSMLIGLSVLPIGSTDITNDIALGFRIPLEEAESIKTGNIMSVNYPKRKVDEIVEARFSDIFELVDGYLKKIKRSGLLPAGIVITGGGSGNGLVEGLARNMLRLPSKVGSGDLLSHIKGPARDSTWFVSFGLAMIAREGNTEGRSHTSSSNKAKGFLKEFLRQFLP